MAQCLKRRKFRRESPEIFSVFRRRRPGADGGGVLPLSTHTKFFIFKTTFLINIGGGEEDPDTFFDMLVSPFFNIRYILGQFCHFVSDN